MCRNRVGVCGLETIASLVHQCFTEIIDLYHGNSPIGLISSMQTTAPVSSRPAITNLARQALLLWKRRTNSDFFPREVFSSFHILANFLAAPFQAMFIASQRRHSFGSAGSKDVDYDSLAKLLVMNTCYEAMPTSGRVVVLDEDLVMCEAFHHIVTHGKYGHIRTEDGFTQFVSDYCRLHSEPSQAARFPYTTKATRHVLLSDAQLGGAIAGILSVTDFIRVLLALFRESKYVSREEAHNLGLLTIRKYHELVKRAGKWKSLVWISAEQSLLEVVRLLSVHRVHRIPVIDPVTSNPLFILTHKRVLKFIWCYGQSLFHHTFITQTPKNLGVGTWEGIRFVYPDTPLYVCLDILLNIEISGLPVVERDTHKVVDVYSRFDAIGLALQGEGFSLEITVREALQFKHICNSSRSPVVSVRDTESLYSVVAVLVDRNVHRVCVVDENNVLQGIISLSDVMKTLVLEPGKFLVSRNTPHRRFSQASFDMANLQLYMRSLEDARSNH